MQQDLLTKPQISEIGEHIGFNMAEEMIKKYFDKNPTEQNYFIIGKNIIEQILAQPGCVGMTMTPALDENGKKTFVYTGIDAEGMPILTLTKVSESGSLITSEAIIADKIGNDEDVRDADIKFPNWIW
jgi:hypothetical protein